MKLTRKFNASQKEIARYIAGLITDGAVSNTIRKATAELLTGNNVSISKKSAEQIDVIYSFMNKDIRYMSDVAGIETLQSAETVLENRYGDCDCKVILAGAMLKSIGYDIALVYLDTVGQADYNHIYLYVALNDRWVSFDACIDSATAGPGQEIQDFKRKLIMLVY